MADETVDEAVKDTAEADSTPESPLQSEDAAAPGTVPEVEDPAEVYKMALALYLEGDAEAALALIEASKERTDIDDRLRGKLDVLKRRASKQATRRFARPKKPVVEVSPAEEVPAGSLIGSGVSAAE
ncbi:MAG: hypothetical protein JKY65_04520, partial [Planctomycetes bacterium]|nr:hypothetical protein [Planctomycetota bacterium]